MRSPREWASQALALAGFGAVAVIYLRPIWAVFGTHIAPDPYDPVFNLYLLEWVGHEVHRGLSGLWDAPFFFPTRGAITYSDHLFGPGLAATAMTGLLPSWVAAHNGLLLAPCRRRRSAGCSRNGTPPARPSWSMPAAAIACT